MKRKINNIAKNVDAHRFYDVYNSKSIAEICIENLFK